MNLCDSCGKTNICPWSCSDGCTECKDYNKQTNEEWFCGLSTEEKATFLASNKMLNFDYQMWIEWLNEVHK